jgi:alanyl-tRNA synthetase
MQTAQIREAFLKFFQEKSHTLVESASLVPHNDPTLLFTNAGMVPFKDVFLGREKRDYVRAASVQKCVRAGGKHNDLENVGFTSRHHTFFEMLGNFSFGDYFKKEAIEFAWELSLDVLKLDPKAIRVSVHDTDDEAFSLWQNYLPKERIYKLGDADNFWQMGDTGPCGPCTELYYDRGEGFGPDVGLGTESERFLEYWNLVFMQYDRNEEGKLNPLPRPSVDTGAGLERLASILQNKNSNFDIDLFRSLTSCVDQILTQRKAKASSSSVDPLIAKRVIADHVRSCAFLIADGVLPSNEGRGYVLRRILRRAVRYGRSIGLAEPFMAEVATKLESEMGQHYPELKRQKTLISKCLEAEEQQFLRTLDEGLHLLDSELAKLSSNGILPGAQAFKLYDTYGFPLDLSQLIAKERGFAVDEPGFHQHMAEQKERSRQNWQGSGQKATAADWHGVYEQIKSQSLIFNGYEQTQGQAECLYVRPISSNECEVVINPCCFYAESGGQLADHGEICVAGYGAWQVVDAQKPLANEMIVLRLKSKDQNPPHMIEVGDSITQSVDQRRRSLSARNHTATHLLHWALRQVLGDHVKQAGSLVGPEYLRFDFSHFAAIEKSDLKKIEDMVNERILFPRLVKVEELPQAEAHKRGAIAMFGEKYGDRVRVVDIASESVEFCGGTHVTNTAEIGLVKITAESSVAAGVRRITAVSSVGAVQYLSERLEESNWIRAELNAQNLPELKDRWLKSQSRMKDLQEELSRIATQALHQQADDLVGKAVRHGEIKLCVEHLKGKLMADLRSMVANMNQKDPHLVSVLVGDDGEKAYLVVGAGTKTAKSAQAILKDLCPLIGGKGGGKSDLAQAGGENIAGIATLVQKAPQVVLGK